MRSNLRPGAEVDQCTCLYESPGIVRFTNKAQLILSSLVTGSVEQSRDRLIGGASHLVLRSVCRVGMELHRQALHFTFTTLRPKPISLLSRSSKQETCTDFQNVKSEMFEVQKSVGSFHLERCNPQALCSSIQTTTLIFECFYNLYKSNKWPIS